MVPQFLKRNTEQVLEHVIVLADRVQENVLFNFVDYRLVVLRGSQNLVGNVRVKIEQDVVVTKKAPRT